MTDAKEILESPDKYGIDFAVGEVKKGDVTLGQVPIVRIVDLDKARAWLGDEPILARLDGQSPRVMAQAKARDAKLANHGATDESIKLAQIKGLMGVRTRTVTTREVAVYIGPDDERFTNRDEAKSAWLEFYATEE